jgi:hypothetical protein
LWSRKKQESVGDFGAEEADCQAGSTEESGGFGVDDEEDDEADARDEGEDAEEDAQAGAVDFGGEEEDKDGSDDVNGEEGQEKEDAEFLGHGELGDVDEDFGEDAKEDDSLAESDFADALVAPGIVEDGGLLGWEVVWLCHEFSLCLIDMNGWGDGRNI